MWTWMNVWKSWAESKGLNDDLVKYEAKEMGDLQYTLNQTINNNLNAAAIPV